MWEPGFLTAEEQPRIHNCFVPFQVLQHSKHKLQHLKPAMLKEVAQASVPLSFTYTRVPNQT